MQGQTLFPAKLTLFPEQRTQAAKDTKRLLALVWDYQEVRRLGFISIYQLQEESGIPWPRFNPALDMLLESPRIYITKSGGLGYTW